MKKIKGIKRILTTSMLGAIAGVTIVPVTLVNAESVSCEKHLQKLLDEDETNSKNEMVISDEEANALENYEELEEAIEENQELESHYSGAYINNNDELVVVLEKDCGEEIVEDVEKIDDDIEIKYAQYTLEELEHAKEDLTKVMENKKELFDFVNAIYIDEMNNCIVIDIIDISDEKIEFIKKYISRDVHIAFNGVEKSDIVSGEATALKGGQAIYVRNGGSVGRGSIGFRAKTSDGKYYGFVTAGHVGKYLGQKVYADKACKKLIGTVIRRQQSGSVDAAFVRITNSNYTMSNGIYYKNVNLNSSVANPVQGATVYKSGSSTGWTSGKVKYTNCNVKIDNRSFTNLAKADYASKSGDSGGTVYEPFYALKSPYTAVGIHVASGGVFVKSNNILSALKLKRY